MISSDDEALKAGNKYEDEYGTGSSSEEDEEETDGEEGNISSGRRKQASSSSSIKIFARVRPPRSNPSLKHHTSGNSNKKYFIEQTPDGIPKIGFKIPKDETHGIVNNSKENYEFQFDRVFDTDTTQEEVFDVVAKDVVLRYLFTRRTLCVFFLGLWSGEARTEM